MELVQAFELIVHRHQLVTNMNRIVNPGEVVEHRLNLCLAGDQDAALRGSWFVGHGGRSACSSTTHCTSSFPGNLSQPQRFFQGKRLPQAVTGT
jgi:hypothetical protein